MLDTELHVAQRTPLGEQVPGVDIQAQLLESERAARGDQDRTITRLERQVEQATTELADARDKARALRDEQATARDRATSAEPLCS